MKTEAKKQKSIGNKLMIISVWFALIVITIATVFVAPYNFYCEMEGCRETAYAYARTASRLINGDKAISYLKPKSYDKNGHPIYSRDPYYETILTYLNTTQSEYDLMKYFYVFVPNEETVTYIWDAENEAGACPLGEVEKYMDGGKEAVSKAFNSDPIMELTVFHDETYGNIVSAYYPVYDSDGEPVAVVGVDLSMERIFNTVIHNVLLIDIFIVILTLIVMAFGNIAIRRRLIQPIEKLNMATKSMVENIDREQDVDLNIHTNDELEELAVSFGKMNADLREYLKKLESITAEKERFGAELSIANQIQADMLPCTFPPYPDRKEFDLFASMTPAKEVGGDFYDFFMVDDDHLALAIADVSGKGVPAALFMAISKTLIENQAQMGGSPGEILATVNNQLCARNDSDFFVTVWFAVIEISTGKGVEVNAGHEHPALCRKNEAFELMKYTHSPALGVFDGIPYTEHPFELHPGDSLFVYTDGVAEANDKRNNRFGTDRMLAALNRDPAASPEMLLNSVRKEIHAFAGDAEQFDDITMMCFKYWGKNLL